MPQPSTTDFLTPFDPTGYTQISGAQLLQLVGGVFPNTGIGLLIVTTDVATVPQVPNASSVTKWQSYMWLRITATAAIPYVWSPSASDPTYLSWVTIAAASIGVGTITGAMIASNTITDSNMASVNWSKIIGAPTNLPPSGAAGGDLSGNYPNPVVANAAITGAKIAAATITGGSGGNFVAQTIQPVNDMAPSGTALAFLRTNAGATAVEWAIADILATNLAVSGNGLKVPQVNSGATAYALVTPATIGARILQRVQGSSASKLSASGNVATNATPNYNATGMNAFFSQAFTPLSASSRIYLRAILNIQVATTEYIVGGIYPATGATAPSAFNCVYISGAGMYLQLIVEGNIASPGTGAMTFYVAFGASGGTGYTNSIDGSTSLFGGVSSVLTIEEYL